MIWTILGISVAVVAVFCISVAETLVGKLYFEQNREYIAAALGVAGIGALFVGRGLAARRSGSDESDGRTSRRFLLFDLRYWGPMLLVLGAITLFIRPLKQVKAEQVNAKAAPAPKPIVSPPVPEPELKTVHVPVKFPKLKMQGVIFREERPFAIINGHSYTVGDRLGDVTVRSIERDSVTLELQGEVQLLTLN